MNGRAPLHVTADISITAPLVKRFWAKVEKTDGCWLWTGKRDKRGYGRMYAGGGRADPKERFAHRIAWIIEHGVIDDGVDVLHSCDNPPCVRPSHLFAGTQTDNMSDMTAKGRRVLKPRKTVCINGHPLEGDNVAIRKGWDGEPARKCRICQREGARRWRVAARQRDPESYRRTKNEKEQRRRRRRRSEAATKHGSSHSAARAAH